MYFHFHWDYSSINKTQAFYSLFKECLFALRFDDWFNVIALTSLQLYYHDHIKNKVQAEGCTGYIIIERIKIFSFTLLNFKVIQFFTIASQLRQMLISKFLFQIRQVNLFLPHFQNHFSAALLKWMCSQWLVRAYP